MEMVDTAVSAQITEVIRKVKIGCELKGLGSGLQSRC